MRPRVIGLLSLGALVILAGLVYLFLQVTDDTGPAAAPAATNDRPRPREDVPPDPETPDVTPGSGTLIAKADGGRPRVDFTTGGGTTPRPSVDPPATGGDDDGTSPDVDIELAMDEANKSYDHNDYEAAVKQALRVLGKTPDSVRMLRIVVSSSCLMGDADTATKYFGQLPARDQSDMVKRCSRYDIALKPTKPAVPAGGG
jgi:hypothetical protein